MKTIFGGRKQSAELLYLWRSKLTMAKVLLKLEFDTEDQVLSKDCFFFRFIASLLHLYDDFHFVVLT